MPAITALVDGDPVICMHLVKPLSTGRFALFGGSLHAGMSNRDAQTFRLKVAHFLFLCYDINFGISGNVIAIGVF
jgi:hypothetical protein